MRYVRPENAADPQVLTIEHGGRLWRMQLLHCTTDERRHHSSHAAHVHDIYHIVLFTKAENEFLLDGRRVASAAGTLVLCPPGVSHDFAPLKPGATLYDEVSFQFAEGERLLSAGMSEVLSVFAQRPFTPLPLVSVTSPATNRRIRQLIALVASEAGSGSPIALFRAHLALAELLAVIVEEVSTAVEPLADRIALAHRNISIRYAQPLSIGSLAGDLGISPAYLSRAFKKRYGLSPLEFRQELRLGAAARLLQTSSLSCKEIAARLGFADVQTFTKAFARHHGHTPGRFSRERRDRRD